MGAEGKITTLAWRASAQGALEEVMILNLTLEEVRGVN